jgi:hypothetical protein
LVGQRLGKPERLRGRKAGLRETGEQLADRRPIDRVFRRDLLHQRDQEPDPLLPGFYRRDGLG